MNLPVRFNQLDGGCELFTGNFFESFGHLCRLKRSVINLVAGDLLPALDPQRAEAAVAVENYQRFFGRPGYLCDLIHAPSLGRDSISVQPSLVGGPGKAGAPIDART